MEGPAPVTVPGFGVVAAADLEPRDEAPCLLVWAGGGGGGGGGGGAAWLISCLVAESGLVACLGYAGGLAGASWTWLALAGLFAALPSLMGERSSLTSIMNLRLAMTGGSSLSNWKSDAKLGQHSPPGLPVQRERWYLVRMGEQTSVPEYSGDKRDKQRHVWAEKTRNKPQPAGVWIDSSEPDETACFHLHTTELTHAGVCAYYSAAHQRRCYIQTARRPAKLLAN
ncbi:hypothetical protein BT67DRAFT_44542 [Trichocladium antarcticum]|uniref:Uncharacterized protein n=1 Tax=Trichocladium antarcticum TaxID=1450529 RepID=A0AAN6ZDH1_9PEZI|nr:hypothetical protein BT67DRAFT_44542 [Trichocladium antarcticum]